MAMSRITESFLHIISSNILQTCFYVSILLSSVVNFIIILFQMFELGIFS